MRTEFVESLLQDEEAGCLQAVEHYVARFPTLAEFVRVEYAALVGGSARTAAARRIDEIGDGGSASDATLPVDAPVQVGRYRILGRLATGGMGSIYLANDVQLDRRVVLKALHRGLLHDDIARERLLREARVLGLLDHPHLAKVLDVIERGDELFVVMPYYEGESLDAVLERARSESGCDHFLVLGKGACDRNDGMRRLLLFFRQAAVALHAAHLAGVVHRDVKPGNLMVARDGSAVVLDFGLAVPRVSERLTLPGEMLGTPLYMAPEVVDGQAADARADVYALGVTLYEALTLQHPFAAAETREAVFRKSLAGSVTAPRRLQPLLSRDLEAVVLRAMEREPSRRYPTAQALAEDLDRLLGFQPTEARPVSRLTAAWRRARRRPRLAALFALVLVLCVLSLALFLKLRTLQGNVEAGIDQIERGRDQEALEYLRGKRGFRPSAETGLVLVHPRGPTPVLDRIVWYGHSPIVDDHARLTHRYRLSVRDADSEIWAAEVEQDPSSEDRWMRFDVPAARIPVGRRLVCRVEWLGDGSDWTEAERRGLDDKWLLAEASFERGDADAVLADSATCDELRQLLDAGHSSLVASILLARTDLPEAAALELLQCAADACELRGLGASVGARRAELVGRRAK